MLAKPKDDDFLNNSSLRLEMGILHRLVAKNSSQSLDTLINLLNNSFKARSIVNERDSSGLAPIHIAIANGSISALISLVYWGGADLSSKCAKTGQTCMQLLEQFSLKRPEYSTTLATRIRNFLFLNQGYHHKKVWRKNEFRGFLNVTICRKFLISLLYHPNN